MYPPFRLDLGRPAPEPNRMPRTPQHVLDGRRTRRQLRFLTLRVKAGHKGRRTWRSGCTRGGVVHTGVQFPGCRGGSVLVRWMGRRRSSGGRRRKPGSGAPYGTTVGGEAEGIPAIIGVPLGPGGEHLPGTDSIQFPRPRRRAVCRSGVAEAGSGVKSSAVCVRRCSMAAAMRGDTDWAALVRTTQQRSPRLTSCGVRRAGRTAGLEPAMRASVRVRSSCAGRSRAATAAPGSACGAGA